MQKKLLSILLVLCMLLSMFPMVLPVGAEDVVEPVEEGAATTADVGGTTAAPAESSENEPAPEEPVVTTIEIGEADELIALMGNSGNWDKDIVLTDNINLGEAAEGSVQAPIGNLTTAFTGTFDGGNFTISGIDIEGTEVGAGLFGVVSGTGAVIKDLTIEGSVTSSTNFVGGLVGIICGAAEIDNVTSRLTTFSAGGSGRMGGLVGGIVNNGFASIADVENPNGFTVTIKNCKNYTTVTAPNTTTARLGGIVGSISPATGERNPTTIVIENCTNYADITGKNANTGGIVGNFEGGGVACHNTVSGCINEGTIKGTGYVAGIIGNFDSYLGATTNLIEKCVNNGTVTASSTRAGGILANITGNTGAATLTVDSCVNNAAVTATQAAGGIVGYTTSSTHASSAFLIKDCENYGAITASANSSAWNAGIAGYVKLASTSSCGTVTVQDCYNEGKITAAASATKAANLQIGGIVAYAFQGYATNRVTITGCWNAGEVSATYGNDIGGILGIANGAFVYDCLNTGTVKATTGGAVGGIVARTAGGGEIMRCYNTGAISATGTKNSVIGKHDAATSYTANALYYTTTVKDANATEVEAADVANASKFSGLNAEGKWLFTDIGVELAEFHEHDLGFKPVPVEGGHTTSCYCNDPSTIGTTVEEHIMVDGVCQICGATTCEHPNPEEEITLYPTCINVGYKNMYCPDCKTTYALNIEIPENPENHDATHKMHAVYNQDGYIDYYVDCCDAIIYSDFVGATDVYVSADGIDVAVDYTFDQGDIGSSRELAFKDFELAMEYAAASTYMNGPVTIHIVNTAEITSANYATPEYEEMITVTGGELWFMTGNRRWFANGPVTFENLTFRTNADNGLKVFAQNNKMVFGQGLVMGNDGALTSGTGYPDVNNVKMYVFGGFENPANNTVVNSDITIRSGDYWFVGAWNDAVFGRKNSGTGKLTIGNKDTDENPDYLYINYVVGYSTDQQFLSEASKTTIIIDGKLDCHFFFPGTQNDLLTAASTAAGGVKTTSDILYETDLVLMGDLNTVATETMPKFDVSGTTTTTNTKLNIYVDNRVATAVADRYIFDGAEDGIETDKGIITTDTTLENVKTVVSVDTYILYCDTYINKHTEMEEDECEVCGYSKLCLHANTHIDVLTPSTCSVAGVGNIVCDACFVVVEENITLELDSSNHDYTGAKWAYDAEKATYVLKCPGCETVAAEAAAPVAYVDAGIIVSAGYGVDNATGISKEEALLTLEEAVIRLSETGGTVYIADRYEITGDVQLPEYKKLISFESILNPETNSIVTGFTIKTHGPVINFNGPTKIDKIIINAGTQQKNGSVGYHYTVVFAAHWNDFEFGTRVATYGNAYFVAGGSYDANRPLPAAINDAEKTVNLVFHKTAAQSVKDSNDNVLESAVTFFDRVYLGDRVRGTGSDEITSYTVSKKTLNVEFHNTTVITLYTATSSPIDIDAQMVDCSTTIDAYDAAYIATVTSGDANTREGTAYLNKLVFNFNDNSRVYESFTLNNVRDLTIKVSTAEEGRASTHPIGKQLICTKSNGYQPTGQEKITLTYGSHSFKEGIAYPAYNAMYNANADVTKVDECTWGAWEVTTPATPEADGVETRTCSVCKRTETQNVKFECVDHVYVQRADGTFYCSACNASLEAPEADMVIKAMPATAENGTVKVNVVITNTTPFWGTKFTVDAPAGLKLTEVTSTLAEVAEGTNAFTFTGADNVATPYNMAVVNLATDANGNIANGTLTDAVVVTLTFAVEGELEETTTFVVSLVCTEAYTVAEEAVDAVAAGAEVTVEVATHTHDYKATVTAPTCTTAGYTTYKCECGDEYTADEVPALNHVGTKTE
ncbi:MAG: hypothetical protein IJC81_05255, partial [Clostridia bacterium]|nr:hypothetical protein [Clostridia bacterium]